MAEGYVDTILLDANRRSSEEVKGDNDSQQSIWTNKLGEGVKLNSGDRVSVHSGYISKRGAGADTIELQGKESGKFITLKKLTKNEYQKQINPVGYYGINVPNCNYSQIAQDYGCIQYTYEDVTYPIKDNEAQFNISYYKTTNGEGYYHLPRRFDAWKTQFEDDSDKGPGGHNDNLRQWPFLFSTLQDRQAMCDKVGYVTGWAGGAPYTAAANRALHYDCSKNGLVSWGEFPFEAARDLQTNYYRGAYATRFSRCLADIHFYQEGAQAFTSHGGFTGAGNSTQGGGTFRYDAEDKLRLSMLWKKKNDGSRYTIFVKEVSYFSKRNPKNWFLPDTLYTKKENMGDGDDVFNESTSRHDYVGTGGGEPTEIHLEYRDIANSEYIKYTETKTLSMTPGNYSPSNIATELTNQLNLTEKQEYITAVVQDEKYPHGATVPPMTPGNKVGATGGEAATPTELINKVSNDFWDTSMNIGKQEVISTTTDSTCYKTFNCSTAVSVEEQSFQNWVGRDSVNKANAAPVGSFHYSKAESAVNYGSAFQFIGVKRPELWEAGRKIAKELGYRSIGASPGLGNSGDTAFTWDGGGDVALAQKPFTTEADPHSAAGGMHTGWSWKQMINPFITRQINITMGVDENMKEAVVPTSWNWNETNLNKLKDFFDVQGKYPELFTGVQFHKGDLSSSIPVDTEVTYATGLTSDNARFLHVAGRDAGSYTSLNNWKNVLGTDFNFTPPNSGGAAGPAHGSDAMFFYFDKSRSEMASGGDNDENLYYGLFQKYTWNNIYSGEDEEVIAFTTKKIGGLAKEYFDNYEEDGAGNATAGTISILYTRPIGYDIHFSAYGTSAINLYDGHLNSAMTDLTSTVISSASVPIGIQPRTTTGATKAQLLPVHQYLNKRYVGAENPQLSFDTDSSKFNFQDLHTPERVGNIISAGGKAAVPIVPDTNDKVYFVNKRLLKKEYCPDMFPYAELQASKVGTTEESLTTYTTFMNKNITNWSIMDSDGGIFIENFGFDREDLFDPINYPDNKLKSSDWKNTLWSMLGFSYEQFHTSFTNQDLTRQTRINNTITTDNIGKPTTNANVEPGDLGQYNTNIYGAQLRTNQIPAIYANTWNQAGDGGDITNSAGIADGYYPSATIQATSAQINAANLPIKMHDPYYLVKSDIITDTGYLGSEDSGVKLPIIAVVNKQGGTGDFFFQGSSQTDFTITAPKVISEIRTQILNPDGSTAILSDDTSIIYKVTKVNNASLNVAQEMMAKTKPKK